MRRHNHVYGLFVLAIAFCCVGGSCSRRSEATRDARNTVVLPPYSDSDGTERRQLRDLGVVSPAAALEAVFAVANDSALDWNLKNIALPCQCITAEMSAERIKPGQTQTLRVKYRAPSKVADESRTIRLHFQEEAVPPYDLTVQCRVRPALTILPQALDLGRVAAGSPVDVSFNVQNYSSARWDDIRVMQANETPDVTASEVHVEPIPAGKSGEHSRTPIQAWKVHAVLTPLPTNAARCTVIFRINVRTGRQQLTEDIHICLLPTAPLRAIPSQLVLGRLSPGTTTSRSITIVAGDPSQFTIVPDVSIEGNTSPFVQASDISIKGRTASVRLLVAIPESASADELSGTVRFTTRGPKPDELTIPISADVMSLKVKKETLQ